MAVISLVGGKQPPKEEKSQISLVGGKQPPKEEKSQAKNVVYEVYFGVFFDGTSNNMIQGSTARKIRSNHAKSEKKGIQKLTSYGWWGENRHKYEKDNLDEKELDTIENSLKKGAFKKGIKIKGGLIRYKYGGFSNVAILFSKYIGKRTDPNNKIIVYKIYVEGSGANDINDFWTGKGVKGLGFGVSKTGVVALVSKAVSAVESRLAFFKGCESVHLHFDVFGFSRGAACARLFSYLVKRKKEDILDREIEFAKYYCKSSYNKVNGTKTMRLSFLDEYIYTSVPPIPSPKTKEVSFLGIFDTVASIGMLRRKKEPNGTSNKFLNNNNIINPLRAGFGLDRDFDENFHDLNVKEYGLFSPQLGVPTFHICAMDEFRENFALTDVGRTVPEKSLELFLPGCHSDIGGGYICNEEEKIVLNKYPTFSVEGLPLIKPEKGCARIFTSNPQCETGKHKPIGLDTMRELGWLPEEKDEINQPAWKIWTKKSPLLHDKAEVKFNKTEVGNDSSQETRAVQGEKPDMEGHIGKYVWWDKGDKIGWKRTVPSFFSNLPLHLMAERAAIITKRNLFVDGDWYDSKNKFWNSGYYDIPKGLEKFYREVKEKINIELDNGLRRWVFPDDDYSSVEYRNIRLLYLHFTSEQKLGISRIWDVQNAIKVGDYYNVISRIVYHGDVEDSGNMHYMFNYKG